MLPTLRPPHDQKVTTEGNTPRCIDWHGEIDRQARVGLKENSESMALGSFDDNNIAVVDISLDVVLVEIVFRYGNSLPAIVMSGEMDLTR